MHVSLCKTKQYCFFKLSVQFLTVKNTQKVQQSLLKQVLSFGTTQSVLGHVLKKIRQKRLPSEVHNDQILLQVLGVYTPNDYNLLHLWEWLLPTITIHYMFWEQPLPMLTIHYIFGSGYSQRLQLITNDLGVYYPTNPYNGLE